MFNYFKKGFGERLQKGWHVSHKEYEEINIDIHHRITICLYKLKKFEKIIENFSEKKSYYRDLEKGETGFENYPPIVLPSKAWHQYFPDKISNIFLGKAMFELKRYHESFQLLENIYMLEKTIEENSNLFYIEILEGLIREFKSEKYQSHFLPFKRKKFIPPVTINKPKKHHLDFIDFQNIGLELLDYQEKKHKDLGLEIKKANIKELKRKIAKDLLVINEKGQPWSVDAYIREMYDFILKATEGQKGSRTKALDAARLVPIFMERFKGIEPRIKSAIKLSTDTDANRLEELVDEFSTKKGLAAIESFLFPDEDIDITEVKKSVTASSEITMNEIIVLDIETTGLSPKQDYILELGIVKLNLENGEIIELFNQVFKDPNLGDEHYKSWIFENGFLKKDEIENAQPMSLYFNEIQSILNPFKGRIMAWNRDFDKEFLNKNGFDLGEDILCPMKTSTNFFKLKGSYGRYKWPKAQEAWDILFPNNPKIEKHRGLDDSKMEAEIIYELYKRGVLKFDI